MTLQTLHEYVRGNRAPEKTKQEDMDMFRKKALAVLVCLMLLFPCAALGNEPDIRCRPGNLIEVKLSLGNRDPLPHTHWQLIYERSAFRLYFVQNNPNYLIEAKNNQFAMFDGKPFTLFFEVLPDAKPGIYTFNAICIGPTDVNTTAQYIDPVVVEIQPLQTPSPVPTATAVPATPVPATPAAVRRPTAAPARTFQAAKIGNVSATSYIVSKKHGPTAFMPEKMTDGQVDTAFQFSVKDTPLGSEYLYFAFPEPTDINSLWIKNGFWKYSGGYFQYERNSRVKSMIVDFMYDGFTEYSRKQFITIPDSIDNVNWTKIDLGTQQKVTRVRFLITDIYQGTEYPNDVCISEVQFVYDPGTAVPVGDREEAVIQTVQATSFIAKSAGSRVYAPEKMTDRSDTTTYQFSTTTTPLGQQYLTFTFDRASNISQLWIKNGFWKINGASNDQYYLNSRVRTMRIEYLYAGSSVYQDAYTFSLPDDSSRLDWTRVNLGYHTNVVGVRLCVTDIYRGNKYPSDVGITEVAFMNPAR